MPVLDLCNHFVRLPDHDSAAAGSLMQSLVPIPPLPSRALSGPSMGWEHLSGKAVHARWFRIARGRTSDEKVPDSVHLPILRQLLLQYGDRSAADQSVHRIELCAALGQGSLHATVDGFDLLIDQVQQLVTVSVLDELPQSL